MAFFVSKEGVWDLIADGQNETPTLTVTNLKAGSLVKITVNFTAQTSLDHAREGFYFSVNADAHSQSDVLAMTPTASALQGTQGWHSAVLIAVFEVLSTTDGTATFECAFSKGDLAGKGTLMNFVMLAELL
jgi:hypothetical protein